MFSKDVNRYSCVVYLIFVYVFFIEIGLFIDL